MNCGEIVGRLTPWLKVLACIVIEDNIAFQFLVPGLILRMCAFGSQNEHEWRWQVNGGAIHHYLCGIANSL